MGYENTMPRHMKRTLLIVMQYSHAGMKEYMLYELFPKNMIFKYSNA